MRFKIDENLPEEACDLLSRAGHDAISVGQQGLGGAGDAGIYQLCQDDWRALRTLDVDFANVQAYDPKSSAGVIVLRLARQDQERVLGAVTSTLPVLEREALTNRLWIVEEGAHTHPRIAESTSLRRADRERGRRAPSAGPCAAASAGRTGRWTRA